MTFWCCCMPHIQKTYPPLVGHAADPGKLYRLVGKHTVHADKLYSLVGGGEGGTLHFQTNFTHWLGVGKGAHCTSKLYSLVGGGEGGTLHFQTNFTHWLGVGKGAHCTSRQTLLTGWGWGRGHTALPDKLYSLVGGGEGGTLHFQTNFTHWLGVGKGAHCTSRQTLLTGWGWGRGHTALPDKLYSLVGGGEGGTLHFQTNFTHWLRGIPHTRQTLLTGCEAYRKPRQTLLTGRGAYCSPRQNLLTGMGHTENPDIHCVPFAGHTAGH